MSGNLPSSWAEPSLDECCLVIQGQSPPGDTYNESGKGLPFFQGKAEFGVLYPTAGKWCTSPTKIAEGDDVLISVRAPVGPTNLSPGTACIGRGLAAIRPLGGTTAKYILYALRNSVDALMENATGSTFDAISGSQLRSHCIRLAPTGEQRRIVAEVEKQFTRLDAAVAALKRVQANLKRYRAAVLKAACEGRLVPTEAELARKEGRNYETGEQLLARILKERRAKWEADQLAKMVAAGKPPKNDDWRKKYKQPQPPDTSNLSTLPEGWAWATWEQVGFSQNGRPFPSAQYCKSGVNLLRPGNLHVSGRVEWTEDNTRCMAEKWEQENPDLVIGPSELVMNLTAQSLRDEFLGRICVTSADEHCLLNQRLARLTPLVVRRRFILWLFKSSMFRRFVDGLNTGSLIQHMFTSQLAKFVLPLPPLEEQDRAIAEVEARLSIIEQNEVTCGRALHGIDTLRQSILKRAFEGKLVPQDLNDEPASVLLERIRAERRANANNKQSLSRRRSPRQSAASAAEVR